MSELRQQIGQPTTSRLWAFVNSAFGIWLLGSVTLSGVTWLYKSLDSHRREETERLATRMNVKEELRTRFSVAEYYLLIDRARGQDQKQEVGTGLARLVLDEANGMLAVSFSEFHKVPAMTLFSRVTLLDHPPVTAPLFLAAYNWKYLEPKLRLRAENLTANLSAWELSRLLAVISKDVDKWQLDGSP